MQKYKFKSSKKNKFSLINKEADLLDYGFLSGSHIEIFSNKRIVIEGCKNIVDYKNNYIKLGLKKGFLSILGDNFFITSFDEERVDVKGTVLSLEFCL